MCSSSSYIRTWKEEHGEQPSIEESMDTTLDEPTMVASASASVPATSTPKADKTESMETEETEKKKPTPPKNKGGKKSKKHHNFYREIRPMLTSSQWA